jgi:hypothetical protein
MRPYAYAIAVGRNLVYKMSQAATTRGSRAHSRLSLLSPPAQARMRCRYRNNCPKRQTSTPGGRTVIQPATILTFACGATKDRHAVGRQTVRRPPGGQTGCIRVSPSSSSLVFLHRILNELNRRRAPGR